MAEPKTNKKKIAIGAVAAVLIVAILAAVIVLVTRNGGGAGGPEDSNGNPLYPKASDVTSVEYLHRGGLDSESGLAIDEKELTDKEGIQDFIEQLKALEIREPTDKERTTLDYSADVEMFTLNRKDGGEDTLLVMDGSISINNQYGNFFYMTDDLDLAALTANFGAMDYSDKLASGSEDSE